MQILKWMKTVWDLGILPEAFVCLYIPRWLDWLPPWLWQVACVTLGVGNHHGCDKCNINCGLPLWLWQVEGVTQILVYHHGCVKEWVYHHGDYKWQVEHQEWCPPMVVKNCKCNTKWGAQPTLWQSGKCYIKCSLLRCLRQVLHQMKFSWLWQVWHKVLLIV